MPGDVIGVVISFLKSEEAMYLSQADKQLRCSVLASINEIFICGQYPPLFPVDLALLPPMPRLKKLRIQYSVMYERMFPALLRYPLLESLKLHTPEDLWECDGFFDGVMQLKQLRSFSFGAHVEDWDRLGRALGQCSKLESVLILHEVMFDNDFDFRHFFTSLSACVQLRELGRFTVYDPDVTAALLPALACWPRLEYLDIHFQHEVLCNDVLRTIATCCPGMTTLVIGMEVLDDAGVEQIGRMKRLQALELTCLDLPVSFLAMVQQLPALKQLHVCTLRRHPRGLENAVIAALTRLPGLVVTSMWPSCVESRIDWM
eukprot:PLAT10027.2.p1 GENE.PLAT10027.2~~PLAT10027.2.p1  ORF type:complete len:317 (-),score=71.87 PLAT10027.2:77-1027(-)